MTTTRFDRALRSLRRDRPLETLAPMFGTLACLAFCGLYVAAIGLVNDGLSKPVVETQMRAGRLLGDLMLCAVNGATVSGFAARSTWAVSAMVYALSLVLVLWAAGSILVPVYRRVGTCLSTPSKLAHLGAAAALLAGFVLVNDNGIDRNGDVDLQKLLFQSLGEPTRTNLSRITTVGNLLTALALAAIPLAACQELEECRRARLRKGRVERLRLGVERLRGLFYVSCAMLASGTVEVWTLVSWPAMHVRGGLHEDLLAFARSFASLVGATFTVYLAAVFLPTAFVIRRLGLRMGAVADAEMSPPEAHDWALKNGLSPSVSGKVVNALAALAPLVIGGAISKIVEVISGQP